MDQIGNHLFPEIPIIQSLVSNSGYAPPGRVLVDRVGSWMNFSSRSLQLDVEIALDIVTATARKDSFCGLRFAHKFEGDPERMEAGADSPRGIQNISKGYHLQIGNAFFPDVVDQVAQQGRPVGSRAEPTAFSTELRMSLEAQPDFSRRGWLDDPLQAAVSRAGTGKPLRLSQASLGVKVIAQHAQLEPLGNRTSQPLLGLRREQRQPFGLGDPHEIMPRLAKASCLAAG